MITVYTALYPEAQELIRIWSLKKDRTWQQFQVFCDADNQIQLVITGTAAIAAAVAVAACATRQMPKEGDLLINYGSCAGGEKIPVGTVFLCNKLVETAGGRTFYPDVLYRHPFAEQTVYSVPAVQDAAGVERILKEQGQGVIDLEAAAIYQAGNYFYAPHQMLFVKVVTDHGNAMQMQTFSETMQEAAGAFAAFVRTLLQMQEQSRQEQQKREALRRRAKQDTAQWAEALHASETMKAQIGQLLWYLALDDGKCRQAEELYAGYVRAQRLPAKDRREGKKILEELRARFL